MSDLSHLEHHDGVMVISLIRVVVSEDMRGLRFLQKQRQDDQANVRGNSS